MADVFISYSRKDIAFVRLIDEALRAGKFETWVDWANSPARENWWKEHNSAIETADVFLLVVSKNSLSSKECREETVTAFKYHKRVIPIVVDDSSDEEIGDFLPDVTKINWIIFRKGSTFQLEERSQSDKDEDDDKWIALPREPEFGLVVEKLNHAIQMDWTWVRAHTRLQNKALEWERKKLESGFLLSGKDLREAEQLFATAGEKKDPQPTGLQRKYLLESRRNESRKQGRLFLGIMAGLILVLSLAFLSFFQQQEAIKQRDEANLQQKKSSVNQLAAQAMYFAERQPDMAMLLGVEEEKLLNGDKWPIGSLEEVLGKQPCLRTYLRGNRYGILSLEMSKDGKYLVSGSCTSPLNEECIKGLIRLWDTSDPHSPRPLGQPIIGHSDWIESLAFHPNNRIFASGGTDGIILWEITSENQVKAIFPQDISQPMNTSHGYEGFEVEFSPNGKLLAAANSDATVTLWNVTDPYTPILLDTPLKGLKAAVRTLAFSPDSRILAAGSDIDLIMLWDISDPDSPVPLGKPFEHNLFITSMAISPDGKLLATASYDRSVVVWDISDPSNPQPVGSPLTENYNFVNFLSFSADGKHLIMVGADGNAFTYQISTQTPNLLVNRLETRQSEVIRSAYVNQDHTVLYYGYGNGSISVLELVPKGETCTPPSRDSGSLKDTACKIANRNLGRDEWEIYLPDQPFQLTCPESSDLYYTITDLIHDVIISDALNDATSLKYSITQAANLAIKTSDMMLESTVCSYGAKYGSAKEVLPLCDDAIKQAEIQKSDALFLHHDIRGVVRAKAADFKGAIEDFRFFTEGAKKYDEDHDQEYYIDDIDKRLEWIKSLEAGNDPFDQETLKAFDTYGTIKPTDKPGNYPENGTSE